MTRPRRAVVAYLPAPVGPILDAFRAAHDPIGALAIAAHITIIHRLADEAETRVADAASRAAPFRVRLAEAVLLDATPPARGVALRVADTQAGLARLCERLATPMSALPHVTLLHPRNSSGTAAEDSAIAAAGRLAPCDLVVDAITLIEEREDMWHVVTRHPLLG